MDWHSLITDLIAKGWTQARIAEACGASQPLISQLQSGRISDTKYAVGQALVKLHRKVVTGGRRETDRAGA